MKKRIWVTARNGALGNAFVYLADTYTDYDFVFTNSKECDLTDQSAVFSFVESNNLYGIINIAANSGGIGLKKHASMLRDNVLINLNIFEAARVFNIKKTVQTLSSGMYPEHAPLPLKESSMHDGEPHESNYAYAYAKRLIDPAVRAYRDEYGIDVIGLVPNSIFGECDKFFSPYAVMLISLISRFYLHKDKDDGLEVWGDGTPLREYTYARDLAKAFMWCFENYSSSESLNVGNTQERSVKEIAYMVAKELGLDQNRIYFNPEKPNGIYRRNTDNSRFLELSGFEYTPMEESLSSTIGWFNENAEKLREAAK